MNTRRKRRLFLALWPDVAVRKALASAAAEVREHGSGRPVADQNLHITLAFLGSVDEEVEDCVRTVASQLSAAAFGLTIDRAGWWQRSGILWLGPSAGPTALNRLVKSLWAALEPCGFWPDFRDFYPHVTIARRWRKARLPEIKPVHWPIDALALLESHTGQRGARYTVLERWPLSR